MFTNKKPAPDLTELNCQTEKIAIDNHERVIFYRLAANQVFFDPENRLIYFVDLEETPVASILESLCLQNKQQFKIELLFLDVNYCFFAGYRVRLTIELTNPLLVALRLQGANIERPLPRANIENSETPWFISKPVHQP